MIFAAGGQKSPVRARHSGNETGLLRDLHGLRTTFGVELVEDAARVRLYRVLAHEQLGGNLPRAEPRRDRLQNLELAGSDAKLAHARRVGNERFGGPDAYFDRHGYLAHDDRFSRSRQLEPEPDADQCEEQGDDAAVNLDRVLDDEKSIFDELEASDQDAAQQAIQENRLFHAPNIAMVRAVVRTAVLQPSGSSAA